MELLVRQWMTEQVFSKWAFEHSPHHHCTRGGSGWSLGLCVYVCVQELGLCVPLSPQAGPFASAGTEGGGVTVCIHECVCMCGCITYVGVKKCYIFTSCCLSLLIEAQQHCRIALAWPLSIPSLKRRALTLLGVREMLCCYTFQPLTPSPPLITRHI